jgi:hypothetical protein
LASGGSGAVEDGTRLVGLETSTCVCLLMPTTSSEALSKLHIRGNHPLLEGLFGLACPLVLDVVNQILILRHRGQQIISFFSVIVLHVCISGWFTLSEMVGVGLSLRCGKLVQEMVNLAAHTSFGSRRGCLFLGR